MNRFIIAGIILAAVVVASVYAILLTTIEKPDSRSAGLSEDQAYGLVEQELEQALSGMSEQEIEDALLA